MAIKILALCAFLLIFYKIRTHEKKNHVIYMTNVSLMFLIVSLLSLLAALQISTIWASFWNREPLEVVPLHAMAVGAVIGVIFADIRNSNANILLDNSTSSEKAIGIAQGLSIGLTLASLIIAVIIPSQVWTKLIDRIHELKAGNFSLSLRETATSVRVAAPPNDPLANRFVNVTGFTPQRINQLQALTYPPAISLSNSIEDRNSYIFNENNSAALMLSALALNSTYIRDVQASYTIQRDRAILYRIGIAQRRDSEQLLRNLLPGLGVSQETLLVNLRPHVVCLATVVDMTKDRRLIDYANFPSVELIVNEVHILAREWMALEKAQSLDTIRRRPASSIIEELGRKIRTRQTTIFALLGTLNAWANRFAEQRLYSESRSSDLANINNACVFLGHPAAIVPSASDLFSPYLPSFAAHMLAAIGDHAGAVRLLSDWFGDLEELEAAARSEASRVPPSNFSWMKVRLLSQLILIQRLSERSELAVPLRTDILRFMLHNFQDVLSTNNLSIWSSSTNDRCQLDSERWKQPLILSYFSYIKEYLDQLNISPTASQDIAPSDFEYAGILSNANMVCFTSLLSGSQLFIQNAQFVLTYVTTTLTWVQSDQVNPASRSQLLSDAEVKLRYVIGRLQQSATGESPSRHRALDDLVYGRADQPLLEAALVLKQRLEEVRAQR